MQTPLISQTPLVSIVLATYNGAKYIESQLESLARQTYRPIELVVSDDSSTDETVGLVQKFAERCDFPVKLVQNGTRLGYIENFFSACGHASGALIAFCDQDDVWYPDKLTVCAETLGRTGALLCAHTLDLTGPDGEKIGFMDQGITADHVYGPCELDPWGVYFGLSVVFREDILALVPPERRGLDSFNFKGLLSHDRWVYFLASQFGQTAVIRRPLAGYRQHGNNVYGNIRYSLWQRFKLKMNEGADRINDIAALATYRAAMLAETGSPPAGAPALAKARLRWEQLARFYQARAAIYRAATRLRRVTQLVPLICRGAYKPVAKGGIGQKRLVQDVVVLLWSR